MCRCQDSIPVLLTQARRCSQHPLDAFEFVQPVLHYGSGEMFGVGDQAGRAGCSFKASRHVAVFREGAVTGPAAGKVVFAEEYYHRHASATADRQRFREFGMRIAVEIADVQPRGLRRKMFENWALIHTIAAPGTGEHECFHVPRKALEQLDLGIGQCDLLVKIFPAATMLIGPVLLQELLIRQTGGE